MKQHILVAIGNLKHIARTSFEPKLVMKTMQWNFPLDQIFWTLRVHFLQQVFQFFSYHPVPFLLVTAQFVIQRSEV